MAKLLCNKDTPTTTPTTIPHFFKIVDEETLHNHKLQIPKKVVRKCGGTFGDQVLLKLPCGSEWRMGLSKSSDGKLWIDKGWLGFSRHYCLAIGHLLVLRYEGDSQFHVLMFDSSTIEIDYIAQQVKKEPNTESGDENLDTFSMCSRPQKRPRISHVSGQSRSLRPPKGKSDMGDGSVRRSSTLLQLSADEKAEALERVSGFESEHPFFILPMQPSFVQTKFIMNVPLDFARKHVDASKNVVLKSPDGRTWTVKFRFRKYYGKSRATIESGWRLFALGNDVKRGDVCVFALTKSTEPILFEVSIFRANEDNTDSRFSQVHKPAGFKDRHGRSLSREVENGNNTPEKKRINLNVKGKDRARETRNSSDQSENPSFTVVLCATYANPKGHFRIPAEFSRAYINKNQSEVRLSVSDGRSWSIGCRTRADNSSLVLRRGWGAFVLDNGLKEGDVCTFELTNREDIISFKVQIAKMSHQNQSSGDSKMQEWEEKTGVGVSRISKLFSKVPHSGVGFRSTQPGKANILKNLPLSFEKSLENKIQHVILGAEKEG